MDESLKIILESAIQAFKEGDYKQAEPLLHQLILKSFKNAQLFYMLGTIQYQKNDIKKAVRSFKRSLEIDPSFTDSAIGLSVIYNDIGHYEEGQKTFMEAKKFSKTSKPVKTDENRSKLFFSKHLELAKLYSFEKNYKETLFHLIKAKNFCLQPVKVQILISECLLNMKEYQKAINELNNVLTHEPKNTAALMRLGQIYSLLGHKNSATKIFQQVLFIDPYHTGANQRLKHLNFSTSQPPQEL